MFYYVRLVGLFLRVSLQQLTTFRARFGMNLLSTALNLASGILGLVILFSAVPEVKGWNLAQTLGLLGIYLLVGALLGLVIRPSLNQMGGMGGAIWNGTFDYTLLTPVPTQFLVSFRHWNLWSFVDTFLSLVVLGISISMLGQQISLLSVCSFLLCLLVSISILYTFFLLLTSVAFWYQGTFFTWIFDSILQLGRYPIGVYPGWLQLCLTWIIPVGFITTVPIQALTGQLSPWFLLAGVLLTTLLFWLSGWFFNLSLRRYSSASS